MLTVWLLCACTPQATEAPEATVTVEPMRLDYNFGAEPLVLDPALIANRTSIEVAAQLFEGLTVFDPESVEPVPALALAWDVSEDGLTYTFRMRDSAQWVTQSGEPQGAVTAEDVAFAIKRVCSPETQTPFKHALFIIKGCQEVSVTEGVPDLDSVGVRALERFTVEFVLEEPASYLPAILALPIARPVPQQAVQQEGQGWTEPSKLLTNGPFLLGAWIPNVSLRLDKNPAYYDAASVGIVRVNGVLRPDSEALALYQSGRLDMARVPPDQMAQLQADPALAAQRLSLPTGCAISYGFTVVKPPVDHARVRRALSLAIDRGRLVADVLQGSATATSRFAPPTVFGAPTSLANVEEDAVQAQSSLAAAGYPGGQGFPSLTLMHPEGEEHARVAAAVADMWRATLRIEVGVVAQPSGYLYRDYSQHDPPRGDAACLAPWLVRGVPGRAIMDLRGLRIGKRVCFRACFVAGGRDHDGPALWQSRASCPGSPGRTACRRRTGARPHSASDLVRRSRATAGGRGGADCTALPSSDQPAAPTLADPRPLPYSRPLDQGVDAGHDAEGQPCHPFTRPMSERGIS